MMKRLTDPTFKYVKAEDTNIRETFARIRKEIAENSVKWGPEHWETGPYSTYVAALKRKGA